ncbi:DUF6163 family protein [Fulvimarina endophytica]|nr:DUF6163 family protein [Fulvimarina endophytica]
MTLELPTETPEAGFHRLVTAVLLRSFAVFLLAIGVAYWAALVGFAPILPLFVEVPARFDLMPSWWRIAVPILAVLYPVAGIGLWMMARWAAVVWGLLVLVEMVMHLGFPILFGSRFLLLAVHLTGLALYFGLRALVYRDWMKARKARRGAVGDEAGEVPSRDAGPAPGA